MRLSTARFGEIQIAPEGIIRFGHGLPGFEQLQQFVVLSLEESASYSFLQSVEDGDLSFIIANPFAFFRDYEFDLPDTLQQELGIQSEADLLIYSMVTIDEQDTISLNLLAPLVVNVREKCGKQLILNQSGYKTRHVLPSSGEVAAADMGAGDSATAAAGGGVSEGAAEQPVASTGEGSGC